MSNAPKNLVFTDEAKSELQVMYAAVTEIVSMTEEAFVKSDLELAARVEPLEQVVDSLRDDIKARHIRRLQNSECTVEHGFVLSDILTNLERVSDHCSNIAGCLIEMSKKEALDLHNYLAEVHRGGAGYQQNYENYMKKYSLPAGQNL